jgi:hypothetical protein
MRKFRVVSDIFEIVSGRMVNAIRNTESAKLAFEEDASYLTLQKILVLRNAARTLQKRLEALTSTLEKIAEQRVQDRAKSET